jgi:hypothetical protein
LMSLGAVLQSLAALIHANLKSRSVIACVGSVDCSPASASRLLAIRAGVNWTPWQWLRICSQ